MKKGKASKAIKKAEAISEKRPVTLTIVAVIFGFLGATSSLALILTLTGLSPLLPSSSQFAIWTMAIFGIMSLITAYLLWKIKLYGAVIGLILIITEIASSLLKFKIYDPTLAASFVLQAILMLLILINWKRFR